MSNIATFFNHQLFATSTVLAYKLPDISSAVVNTFRSGDNIGTIDSFVSDPYNNHYFVIYSSNDITGTPFYILIDPYSLSVPAVADSLSSIDFTIPPPVTVDSTQPFGITDFFSNILNNIEKIIPFVIVGIVAINVLPSLLKKDK